VIIDEQHRFGVGQRAALRSKGVNPHLLVMSATPIPRSLALTIYGDLDLSVIDEMPVGRIPIETHVMLPNERERAYQLIQSQVEQSHQAFIIYPLIESENDEIRKAAINEYERIRSQVFPHLKIGLMHGRLKQSEKDEIMKKFRDKEFDILISTSVIEVGLDIPNATIVLIESANHFGLSQLHQIRGRVGRGQVQSYCLLIPDFENNFENERLAIMAETNDGFKLAEYDLKQRGPGDFLGTRQSGYLGLKLASLTDLDLILHARKAAQKIFNRDPELASQENQWLRQEMETYWPSKSGDVS
jgi:ATP-dependent DNA helicase RecG